MKPGSLFLMPISILALGYLYATTEIAKAQITPDSTVNTQVNQSGSVSEINGGETRGDNLFHSFQEFSVGAGNEAFFNNANSIKNIFSRVTGGNVSNIDGLIRANGSASLFLINPAGIIFGEGARLDLGGSFYGSSANSILFPDDLEFSATDTQAQPVLTINAPIGLGFRDNPGDITNNSVANDGRGLEVSAGKDLALIGGNVSFDGGIITAPSGRVELGGLTDAGTINIDNDGSFSFPEAIARGNLSLANGASVNIAGNGGGFININANDLRLTEESTILAGIGEGLGSADAVAGNINIEATSIFANQDSQIRAETEGTGKAGTIDINADTLDFIDGSAIVVSTFGQGDAGTVNITAKNISFDREWGGIYSTVGLRRIEIDNHAFDAVGNGGVINIDTDTLSLTKGARILGNTIAQGNAGTININATGEVSYIGQGVTPVPAFGDGPVISGSFSQVREDAIGSGGDVTINAGSLTLIDKGAVLVDSRGSGGDAGNININVKDKIFLDKTGLILSQVQEGAKGNGGDINIRAGSLEAQDFSFILADTKGTGNAGNITFNIDTTLSLDGGSAILTEAAENAQGNGGNIIINAPNINVFGGSFIQAGTSTTGNAGNITLSTNDLNLVNGGIKSTSSARGNAGSIKINASNLISVEKSELLVDSEGTGNGGNIFIKSNSLSLDDDAKISALTAFGQGSNITLEIADNLVLRNNSLISAEAIKNADGGNINIDTNFIVAFPNENNDIRANAEQGEGGNINITAESIFGIEERPLNDLTNDINASSESNLDGTVSITILEPDAIQGTTKLPTNPIQPQQISERACAASQETGKINGLTIKGKGGVIPAPNLPLTDNNIMINGNDVTSQVERQENLTPSATNPIMIDGKEIIPAQGVVKTKDGRVILTAYPTSGESSRVPTGSANCARS